MSTFPIETMGVTIQRNSSKQMKARAVTVQVVLYSFFLFLEAY